MPGWVEPPRKPSRRAPDPDPFASSMPRKSAAASVNAVPNRTAPAGDPFAAGTPTAEQHKQSTHATPPKQAPTPEERELAKQLWAALEAVGAHIAAAPTEPPKAAPAQPRKVTNATPPATPAAQPIASSEVASPHTIHPTVDPARQRRLADLADDLHRLRRWIVDMDVAHVRPVGSPLPQFLAGWQLDLLAYLLENESRVRAGEAHPAERTWGEAEFQRDIDYVRLLWYALGQVSEQLHCRLCGAAGTFSRRPPANRDERHGIGDHKRFLTQCATCGQLVCYECLQDDQCRQCRKSQGGGLFGRRRG